MYIYPFFNFSLFCISVLVFLLCCCFYPQIVNWLQLTTGLSVRRTPTYKCWCEACGIYDWKYISAEHRGRRARWARPWRRRQDFFGRFSPREGPVHIILSQLVLSLYEKETRWGSILSDERKWGATAPSMRWNQCFYIGLNEATLARISFFLSTQHWHSFPTRRLLDKRWYILVDESDVYNVTDTYGIVMVWT